MRKRISTWLACALLLCGGLAAQNTAPRPVVKGKVVDQGGETVIGSGSTIGANTYLTRSVPPNSRVLLTTTGVTIEPKGTRHS